MIKLSECEEQILIAVWKSEEQACLKVVQADVNSRFAHEWKSQTVSTFLSRLVQKGYLKMERKGRNAYYHPEISLEQYRKVKLQSLLKIMYDDDVEAVKRDINTKS